MQGSWLHGGHVPDKAGHVPDKAGHVPRTSSGHVPGRASSYVPEKAGHVPEGGGAGDVTEGLCLRAFSHILFRLNPDQDRPNPDPKRPNSDQGRPNPYPQQQRDAPALSGTDRDGTGARGWECTCSIMEVYNDVVRDLLALSSGGRDHGGREVLIRDDPGES
eukprot:1441460-Rhodomonas_salina.1